MTKKRTKLGIILAALLSLGSVFTLAPAASATNPPYANCPANAVCFYQDGNGAGSKFYLWLGSGYGANYNLGGPYTFLNGQPVNDQISSVYAPRCTFTFYANYGYNVPDHGGFYYPWDPSQTNHRLDFSGNLFNDQMSSVEWWC